MTKQIIGTGLFILFCLVAIGQAPVANFTSTATTGCAPLGVNFTDQSTGSPTLWNWDFGNGQLSSAQNPSVSFNAPGTYTVKLVVRNANGTDGITKTNYITVFPSPVSSFTANTNISCSPATIQFSDGSQPSGAITSWNWDFGDGSTSTQPSPSHVYTGIGYYNVTLTVTTANGCTNTNSALRFIRIINGISPDFDFSRSTACQAPITTNFTNQTAGPGTISYNWSFGDGQTSTLKNPTNIYATPGTYNVTLTASSNLGCNNTITKPVVLGATSTIINSVDFACPNQPITFTNASTPAPVTSAWDFGDGTGSSQTNPTKTYSIPGIYNITLTTKYAECTGKVTKAITINNPPAIDFSSPNRTGCKLPDDVNFVANAPGATTWLWNFGDGTNSTTGPNVTHQYTRIGDFDVTLTTTSAGGCPSTITKKAFVQIRNTLSLSVSGLPAAGCAPFDISPVANILSLDPVVSYNWNFGDGGTSTLATPTHTYLTAGNYNVSLQITTAGGCSDNTTINNAVMVGNDPVSDFVLNPVPTTTCAGDSVHFLDQSTPAAAVDRWDWDFGDGSNSTTQNPVHQFQAVGNLNVTLTAYSNGCRSTTSKTIVVPRTGPVAKFKPTVDCATAASRLTVVFVDQSILVPANAATTTYSWNFGPLATPITTFNGTGLAGAAPPPITYPAQGKYPVTLTVADGTCTYTLTKQIDLTAEVANFKINKAQVCRYEPTRFETVGIDTGQIAKYEWQIGGGPVFQGNWHVDTIFNALSALNQNVSLIITDTFGCVNGPKLLPFAVVGKDAGFNVATGGCVKTDITLTDASTPANGTVTNWTFNYGDGFQVDYTQPPFSHRYTDSGIYNINLYIKDSYGCQDTANIPATITITQAIANFGADATLFCQGPDLQFRDSSIGRNLVYNWNFGDGATSTAQNPVHAYSGADKAYDIKLKVTDATGCSDSLTRSQYIKVVKPVAKFDTQDSASICAPLQTFFNSTSKNYDSLFWDFGDGNTSTLDTTSNFYSVAGQYTVKLYATGFGGCKDSASSTVHIYEVNKDWSLNYNPAIACNSLNAQFTIVTPPFTKFTLYYGDGGIDTSQNKNPTHFYGAPNNYGPYFVMTDNLNCQIYVGGIPGSLQVNGVLPLFNISKKKFCDTGTVFIEDFTVGNDVVVSRNWDFGDGTNSPAVNPTHQYSQPGTFIVSQTAKTQKGCVSTFSDTVRVYRTPIPVITAPDAICIDNQLLLQGSTQVADTGILYNWTYGNQVATTQNVSLKPSAAGSLPVKLETSILFGCKDTTSKVITLNGLPSITLPSSITTTVGGSIGIPVSYSGNMTIYNWTPATYLDCSNCANPTVLQPKFTTKYNISVVDSNTCTASADITVNVVCNNLNYFMPNTFSPNGDGVNDWFYPRGKFLDNVQSLRVFNRWGELIFQKKNFPANNMTDGWNGTYKGKPANPDTYIYIIEIICENAQIVPIKGNITLIR